MIRRLRKLSWDGHRLLVRWDQARKGDWDEYELHCGEAPLPSLLTALQGLTGSVSKICELDVKYCTEGFALRGVSVSYTEADVMGATITALKYLKTARAPLVLNTPHLMAAPVSETDEAPLLPGETVTAIETLEAEAWRYVAGERAQGDLFAGEAGKVAAAGGAAAAVVDAVAALAPEPGSGIESVTLSSGGRSATLRQGRRQEDPGQVRGRAREGEAPLMRHLFAAIVVIALGGSFVGAGSLHRPTPTAPELAPPYPTTAADTALGFLLRSARTAVGLTQDSLSKLTGRTVSAAKLSRLERGLDTATVAQQDTLYRVLARFARRRVPSAARTRVWWIAARNVGRP